MDNTKVSLEQIYKDFQLRYNVNEARKFLNLDKNTPRKDVNNQLRELYDTQNPRGYVYAIRFKTQFLQFDKKKNYYLSNPEKHTFRFFSENNHTLKRPFIYDVIDIKTLNKKLKNKIPVPSGKYTNSYTTYISDILWNIPDKAKREIEKIGSGSKKMYEIVSISKTPMRYLSAVDIKNIKLYNAKCYLPYKEFNGFKDTGKGQCVAETILYHIQKKNRNKKQTLEKVIDVLERYKNDEDEEDIEYCFDEMDYENPEDNKGKGYTPLQIINTLQHYNCRGRLLDINYNDFIQTNNFNNEKFDKNLSSFLGICYGGHLYYCEDEKLIKSFSQRKVSEELGVGYKPETKKPKKEKEKEIHNVKDLTDYYIEQYKKDNTIRNILTCNGDIVRIDYDDKIILANPDKDEMIKMIGEENFKNQNFCNYGKKLFEVEFTEHKQSEFIKDVFDKLKKHGNIVKSFNNPIGGDIIEYDINKCRTSCLLNNKLGDYEIFDVYSNIEKYDGKIKKGLYYVIPHDDDSLFYLRGEAWYSGDFIKKGLKYGENCDIEYQILATDTLPKDYFKNFTKEIIKDYPNHYKILINTLIGNLGKTKSKLEKGYIEKDYELAVSAFWNNNDDKLGFICETEIDKNNWKNIKNNYTNISPISIDDETHYNIFTTESTTLYKNDLPIFNKILENEYLKLYDLIKKAEGNLISIKTDAIIIDGCYNKLKTNNLIGGIKKTLINPETISFYEHKQNYKIDMGDIDLEYNVKEESIDNVPTFENESYCILGLAGYGKSYEINKMELANDKSTIKLGFSNVSKENISSEENLSHTINSYFSVNFTTGKVKESKLKNLKNIKTIIITEVFMTPPYLMSLLYKIKKEFPEIRFICEGDPEQTRPVGNEDVNWLNSKLFHTLVDANLVKLTINKRNNQTENYFKAINGDEVEDKFYGFREPQKVNITRTNQKRIEINKIMMDKDINTIEILHNDKHYEKGQDVKINISTPIMCIKNNKTNNVFNGKRYSIQEITDEYIKINNVEYSYDDFMKNFVVCYAMTNHKIQGLTIHEDYNIYEWNMMSSRERYTAFSRMGHNCILKII